jgi:hypothetical protein
MIACQQKMDLSDEDGTKRSVKFIAAGAFAGVNNRTRAGVIPSRQEYSLRPGQGLEVTSHRDTFVLFSPRTVSPMWHSGSVWITGSRGARRVESFTGGRRPPLSDLTALLPFRNEQEQWETYYGQLGWSKGPFAASEVRNSTREFWLQRGAAGAEWLIGRIGNEAHSDALDSVANLLADLGLRAVEPIFRKLQNEPTYDQSEVLLKALGWIESTDDAVPIDPELREKTLARYFVAKDSDIRAAAYGATRILPRERAIALLRGRRASENDSFAVGALDEALEARLER